jgi:hypothetical protein
MYYIGDYQSEPGHQHQNYAENKICTLVDTTNFIMDRTGAKPELWLLCLQYVSILLNNTVNPTLGTTPLIALTGITNDTSKFVSGFYFNEPVLYSVDNKFPSSSPEQPAHWVGFGTNVGDELTFKLLTDDTQKIIYHSAVHSRNTPNERNLCVAPFGGEENPKPIKVIKSKLLEDMIPNGNAQNAFTFNPLTTDEIKGRFNLPDLMSTPDPLIGRTFLTEEDEDGQRYHALISR